MAITGIGSGLDISNIVKALVDADSAPKAAQLNRLERATTSKISGLGQFSSALSEFQTVLKDLNSAALFEKRTATSGKSDIFSVTANSSAVAGNYNVQVFNLAQSSKVALRGVDNPTDAVGTGTLTVNAGDTTLNIDITEANNSLAGIRDAINAAGKDRGISATIVNDPSGAGGARLVLSSSTSGTGNDISVSVAADENDTGDLGILAFAPPAPDADFTPTPADPDDPRAPRVISYARDANLAIDGIAMTSATNIIASAVEGVTITLKAAQSADDIANANTVSLTVAEDRAGVKTQLTKFVDAYNKMLASVNTLTSVTSVGGDDSEPLAAALVGDASVRSFMSAMRTELGSAQGSDGIRILADLGISTQRDGTLKIDDAKLDKALADNFEQVAGFLTGGDTGLMARLDTRLDPYTQSGGILDGRTKALQNTLNGSGGVDEQRDQLTRRAAQMEARLLAQFNAMDGLVAQLSNTSDYLTSQLANLPGVVRQDSR